MKILPRRAVRFVKRLELGCRGVATGAIELMRDPELESDFPGLIDLPYEPKSEKDRTIIAWHLRLVIPKRFGRMFALGADELKATFGLMVSPIKPWRAGWRCFQGMAIAKPMML